MGSRPLEVADAFEANELFDRNGWTDGLPIVPPTPELVRIPFAVIFHPSPRRRRAPAIRAAEALHRCQEILLQR